MAHDEDELSFAALEGGFVRSKADDSTKLALLAAVCQSEPEMAAMLTQAAESLMLEWTLPSCPFCSLG